MKYENYRLPGGKTLSEVTADSNFRSCDILLTVPFFLDSVAAKIQFMDNALDHFVIIPCGKKRSPLRPFPHMDTHLSTIDLHQHIRALGTRRLTNFQAVS